MQRGQLSACDWAPDPRRPRDADVLAGCRRAQLCGAPGATATALDINHSCDVHCQVSLSEPGAHGELPSTDAPEPPPTRFHPLTVSGSDSAPGKLAPRSGPARQAPRRPASGFRIRPWLGAIQRSAALTAPFMLVCFFPLPRGRLERTG